jgi:transposase
MNGFELTPNQIQELQKTHRALKDKRAAYRINVIYLLGTGWLQAKVCEALMLDEGTLRHYVKRYREGGIKNLISEHYLGGQSKLTLEEIKKLDNHVQETLYIDAKSVANYVKKTFGTTYTVRGMTELLKRLGFVYKKPKVVPGKADSAEQEAHVKRYKALKNRLKPGDTLLFMDAVHPQHNTIAAYGWIKKGQDKEIKSNSGRQRMNINGALDIQSCKAVVTFEETLNAVTAITLLKKLRRVYRQSGKIYLICDNAGYYKNVTVESEARKLGIKFVFLPAYSPNLNLIERFWKFFKKKVMYNKYYEKFKDFKNAVSDFFNMGIKKYKSELKSLLTENFQIIGHP